MKTRKVYILDNQGNKLWVTLRENSSHKIQDKLLFSFNSQEGSDMTDFLYQELCSQISEVEFYTQLPSVSEAVAKSLKNERDKSRHPRG